MSESPVYCGFSLVWGTAALKVTKVNKTDFDLTVMNGVLGKSGFEEKFQRQPLFTVTDSFQQELELLAAWSFN